MSVILNPLKIVWHKSHGATYLPGVHCPTPPDAAQSVKVINGEYYTDTTVYTCNTGYAVNPNSAVDGDSFTLVQTITCQDDGTWSSVADDCHGKYIKIVIVEQNKYNFTSELVTWKSDIKIWCILLQFYQVNHIA